MFHVVEMEQSEKMTVRFFEKLNKLVIKKGWSYKYGIKLHPLQLRILVKGLNMLKEGGELVYSTCSLNPVEDESVVLVCYVICRSLIRLLIFLAKT